MKFIENLPTLKDPTIATAVAVVRHAQKDGKKTLRWAANVDGHEHTMFGMKVFPNPMMPHKKMILCDGHTPLYVLEFTGVPVASDVVPSLEPVEPLDI